MGLGTSSSSTDTSEDISSNDNFLCSFLCSFFDLSVSSNSSSSSSTSDNSSSVSSSASTVSLFCFLIFLEPFLDPLFAPPFIFLDPFFDPFFDDFFTLLDLDILGPSTDTSESISRKLNLFILSSKDASDIPDLDFIELNLELLNNNSFGLSRLFIISLINIFISLDNLLTLFNDSKNILIS